MTLRIHTLSAYRDEIRGLVRDNRVVWLAEELAIPYERVAMAPGDHRKPEFLALNPFGKVPTIEDDGVVMFESAAICLYLAGKHGRLMPPVGSPDYAIALQWCLFGVTNLEPQAYRVFAADFTMEDRVLAAGVRELAVAGLQRFLPTLDTVLRGRETILESGFSVADVLLVTALLPASRSQVLEEYANLWAWVQRMTARPAYRVAAGVNGN